MNEQQIVNEVLAELAVENPCPMILARMRGETNGEYYCKSCDKNLVDFRGCSQEEIQERMAEEPNLCGIFYQSQLTGQYRVRYSFWQRAAFVALVILSFVGFNVKPLNAQSSSTDSTATDSTKTIKVGWNDLLKDLEPVRIVRGLPVRITPAEIKAQEREQRKEEKKQEKELKKATRTDDK